jgi:nucleotide-binding universal stress UspA family protein
MREIVVGVDESAASERALDRALLEAEQTGRDLRLLHTWTPPVVLGAPPGFIWTDALPREAMARHAEHVLDEVLAKGLSRRASNAPVSVRGEVRVADPGRELARQSSRAALVVVGGKGRGALASGLLGSATSYLVNHAGCPVMVVPGDGPPVGRARQVVVGVDGSACSRAALRWALDAAARHGCPLLAVHCVTGQRLRPSPPDRGAAQGHAQDEAATWLEQELAAVVPAEAAERLRSTVVRGGATAGLLDQASGPDDLLVVGSRGRGGFRSLLLGSTATQCVQYASGTVVVVRSDAEPLDD